MEPEDEIIKDMLEKTSQPDRPDRPNSPEEYTSPIARIRYVFLTGNAYSCIHQKRMIPAGIYRDPLKTDWREKDAGILYVANLDFNEDRSHPNHKISEIITGVRPSTLTILCAEDTDTVGKMSASGDTIDVDTVMPSGMVIPPEKMRKLVALAAMYPWEKETFWHPIPR